MRLLCSGNINGKEYFIIKQILHGNINSYFYVDSIATMSGQLAPIMASPHFQFKKSFDFPVY